MGPGAHHLQGTYMLVGHSGINTAVCIQDYRVCKCKWTIYIVRVESLTAKTYSTYTAGVHVGGIFMPSCTLNCMISHILSAVLITAGPHQMVPPAP